MIVVNLPARLGAAQEAEWVERMVARVLASERRRRRPRSDDELFRRAIRLAEQYLDPALGHTVRPSSVRWVTNQNTRWGSCTVAEGSIRLSHRLQGFPDYVVDHVLLHELVHLVEAHHNDRFRSLLARHPMGERAEGFLQGWSMAQGQPQDGVDPEA